LERSSGRESHSASLGGSNRFAARRRSDDDAARTAQPGRPLGCCGVTGVSAVEFPSALEYIEYYPHTVMHHNISYCINNMGLQTSFDRLSALIGQYDRDGRSVRHVEARSDDDGRLHATLEVPVSLCAAESGDVRPAVSPTRATLTDDGSLQVEFATPGGAALPESATVEEQTVRVTDGGDILLRVGVVVDTPTGDDEATAGDDGPTGCDCEVTASDDESTAGDDEMTAGTPNSPADGYRRNGPDREPESALAAVRDESVPPYEDTAYLQRLYETCDTFAEMSREIEMDVAGETVRRYMIDAGVHTPCSYETTDDGVEAAEPEATDPETTGREVTDPETTGREAADGRTAAADAETTATVEEAEPPADGTGSREKPESVAAKTPARRSASELPDDVVVTDGVGLPDGVQIEDVAEAVTASSTVYDVQRRLGLGGEQTWELLQQLDLLELLVGRISDGPKRSISYESVTGRIRRSAVNSA
jgi:hypothetical protein